MIDFYVPRKNHTFRGLSIFNQKFLTGLIIFKRLIILRLDYIREREKNYDGMAKL